MPLTLYYHPLSSFCWKVLIALYENETPFTPHLVDLADEPSRARFQELWPIAKFPVLRDDAKGRTVPESSIVIEYLAQHYLGKAALLPADLDLALEEVPLAKQTAVGRVTTEIVEAGRDMQMARNKAVEWLEKQGVVFGPQYPSVCHHGAARAAPPLVASVI